MLSTNQSSSIQRRRQLHRRQNSLEVPILVAPLSATQRRPIGHHRRGLSLDQSTNQQPHPMQEQDHYTTNTGRPHSQHSMQAQLQIPAQPGFPMGTHQQLTFHNQQMFPSNFARDQSMVQEVAPREQALQNLNHHIQSFMQRFGPVSDNNVPQPQPQPQMAQYPQPLAPSAMQRPVTPADSYMQTYPSSAPPRRAERVLLDVAPMPNNFANVPLLQVQDPAAQEPSPVLLQESFGSEYGYPSSYASSYADPSSPIHSPARQNSVTGMPTLYENISPVSSQGPFGQESLLLSAQGTPDLRYMTDSPMRPPMSPREMMLQNLDIDASIEDTGISAEEVQQYISEQNQADGKWTCLFDGCYKKFGRKENIKSHVQTHLGDRQFKCNHCGKCFVRQHDLKRHAKIHSGDKPHKCPCGNGFARQDALTRHRQRGVCEGALPGFERREVKRGRPRKTRPDMGDRIDKASRSRMMDARRGSEASGYDSSSPSDRSYPDTPPNNDFEEDPFSTNFNSFMKAAYESTPPTSPAASSPAKVAKPEASDSVFWSEPQTIEVEVAHVSTPPRSSPPPVGSPVLGAQNSGDAFASAVFDFGPLDAQPKVCEPSHVFSPAQSSSNGSEWDHQSPEAFTGAETFMGAEPAFDMNNSYYGPSEALFQASFDAWEWSE